MNIFLTRDLAMFYRQLSSLLASGIPIIEALDSLAHQAGPNRIQAIAMYMKQDVVDGAPLSEAFAKLTHTFPSWHINVIKYSEKSGHLAADFDLLAAYLEKEYSTQLSIVTKLAYPVLLLHIAFVLLPFVNAFTCGAKGYIGGLLGLVLPVYGLLLLVLAIRYLIQNSPLKIAYDRAVVNVWLIGPVMRQFALTRFIRALRCLCTAGVPIVSAWNMAAEACGNDFLKTAIHNGSLVIEQGQPISKALIQAGVFKPQTISMIASAEKSGTLVQMLTTINTYYEKETDAAIGIISVVVPTVVYLLIAGFIGLRIISFYSGYFQRVSTF